MDAPFGEEVADFPAEAVRQLLIACLGDEHADVESVLAVAHHKFVTKQQATRFRKSVEYMNQLLPEIQELIRAGQPQTPHDVFRRLLHNAETIWSDACTLLEKGSFATATALAISCMEEIGKLAIAKAVICIPGLDGGYKENAARLRGRGRHERKMMVVAGAAALVNARLDSLLGIETVELFLAAAANGQVEQERRRALYSDCLNGDLHIPCDAVKEVESTRYVVLAGECLLDVGGVDADEFTRIREMVEAFECRHGFAPAS